MTRRPILCLNGKPTRYFWLYIASVASRVAVAERVEIDNASLRDAKVSYGTRPSGRRIIWVHVPEVE